MRIRGLLLATAASVGLVSNANAINIVATTDATTLVSNILGPGVTVVGTPTFTGGVTQAGTFTNGLDSVPFASGIVLHSGDVADIPGPNDNTNVPETLGAEQSLGHDVSVDLEGAGSALIADSFDAATLNFSFQFGDDGSVGGNVFFGFAFASEEYIDYVGTEFNDEFRLLINGVNVALVGGIPVDINNVNPLVNSGSYVNNVENTNGYPVAGLNFGFDGRTTLLQAQALNLAPGTHTATFVVADVSDGILDAAVFIRAGSFDPTPELPEPGTLALLGLGLAGLGLSRRRKA